MDVPGRPRKRQIDFVRGVAILMVMCGHFKRPMTGNRILDTLSWIATFGGHGVDLFFVLSGFLVGGLLLREYRDTGSIRPVRFLLRRAFKIWPPFYFLILFHLVARRHPLNTFFWQNVLQVQNYFPTSIRQTWSLAVEEHFYLLLAAMLWFAASRKWTPAGMLKMIGAVSAASFVCRCIYAAKGLNGEATFYTQNRLDCLFIGVALGLVYHFMPELYRRLSLRVWPLLAVIVAGAVAMFLSPGAWFDLGVGFTILYLVFSALFLLVVEHSGKLVDLWLYRLIAELGIFSYGIYLWHSSLLSVGDALISRMAPVPAWFAALAAQFIGACVLGYVMTRLVEWPMLRWRESIPMLRDTKPLAQSPDKRGSQQEGPGGDHEGGAEAVLIRK